MSRKNEDNDNCQQIKKLQLSFYGDPDPADSTMLVVWIWIQIQRGSMLIQIRIQDSKKIESKLSKLYILQ